MNAFACIRRAILLSAAHVLAAGLCLSPVSAQEACLKGCAYPDYPGMLFILGDGFVAKGGEVKVTHMGFLGQVYNNDGITPRKVGVPNYIGELSVLDPVTGEDKPLFRNQKDWVTHENDSGKVISLGIFPKGAPIVFKYVNVDGKEKSFKTFPRYSGDNVAGTYDFNADPVLKSLAINGKAKPVSGGVWDWEGHTYNRWCVAASVPGTDEKQFQFEDADDRIFNDIVFRVSGVGLTSESFHLLPPSFADLKESDGSHKVSLLNDPAAINVNARIFYTMDGSDPKADSSGLPLGTTKQYVSVLPIAATTTIKALAWKRTEADNGGNITRFEASDIVSATYTVARLQWSKPAAAPPGGAFTGNVSVTLSQAEGAMMYYRICDAGTPCDPPTTGNTSYGGAPFTLSGSKVLKVIAIQSPRDNSEVAEFLFAPVFKVTDAVYFDRNGDGRIESARISVEGSPTTPPLSVFLIDPFNAGRKVEATGADLKWDSAGHTALWADFSDRPFSPGTGFATGPFGAFKDGGGGYNGNAFNIRDGAGPMVVSAEAQVSLDSGGTQRLIVKFSEAVENPGQAGFFPLQVRRGNEDITGKLQVAAVEALGGDAYRYSFSSVLFPIPTDSLRLTSQAKDASGNPGNMSTYVEVTGKMPTVAADMVVSGGGCVRGGPITAPHPLDIPISVIAPRDPGPAAGCAEIRKTVQCLDCLTQEWKKTDPARFEADALPPGPEVKVTTRWPFTFDLAYFSTLGELVNRAKGEVTEEMLKGVAADAQGYKTVSLQWYPVSISGTQAATGAYVVKGFVATKTGASRTLVLGIPVSVPASSERVLLRFGYVRD